MEFEVTVERGQATRVTFIAGFREFVKSKPLFNLQKLAAFLTAKAFAGASVGSGLRTRRIRALRLGFDEPVETHLLVGVFHNSAGLARHPAPGDHLFAIGRERHTVDRTFAPFDPA